MFVFICTLELKKHHHLFFPEFFRAKFRSVNPLYIWWDSRIMWHWLDWSECWRWTLSTLPYNAQICTSFPR